MHFFLLCVLKWTLISEVFTSIVTIFSHTHFPCDSLFIDPGSQHTYHPLPFYRINVQHFYYQPSYSCTCFSVKARFCSSILPSPPASLSSSCFSVKLWCLLICLLVIKVPLPHTLPWPTSYPAPHPTLSPRYPHTASNLPRNTLVPHRLSGWGCVEADQGEGVLGNHSVAYITKTPANASLTDKEKTRGWIFA